MENGEGGRQTTKEKPQFNKATERVFRLSPIHQIADLGKHSFQWQINQYKALLLT
jgi:hypothetical protein